MNDKSEYDGKIVTLSTEEGNKPGQPIGTYVVGRTRYMVFLPSSAPVGKNVRVKLVDTGRKDRRETTLFRAEPAPAEYAEQWKDNGDGTASRVTIATNWLGDISEEGVRDTRPLEKREGTPSIQSNLKMLWGQDLATSVIEDSQVRFVPLEEEKVESGQIVWRKTGERQEPIPITVTYPIIKIELEYCQLNTNRLQVTYNPSWSVQVTVYYRKPGIPYDSNYSLMATWTTMPKWWREEWEARCPVCTCGRQRRDSQVADAYGKCELCRAEETCVRCGKKITVKNLSGRLVCRDCEPFEAAEQMIETKLPHERREVIAEEARRFRSGQPLVQEEGEMVLKVTAGHITSSWTRDRLVQRWSGYGWYYFCEDGIYGSIFPPAALSLLAFLPQSSGNSLVELVSWFPDSHKSTPGLLYFVKTQVLGQKSEIPSAEHQAIFLNDGRMQVAVKLRGSEADRIAALAGYQSLVEKLGVESKEVKTLAEILQSEEQDYAKAVSVIREYHDREEAAARGEIWLDVKVDISSRSRVSTTVRAITADGIIIEPTPIVSGSGRHADTIGYEFGDLPSSVLVIFHEDDNYGYRNSESWTVHLLPKQVTQAQISTVRRLEEETRVYFRGPGSGWNLSEVGDVKFSTAYHRDFQGIEEQLDKEMRGSLPIDVTKWVSEVDEQGVTVVGPYRKVDKFAKKIHEVETAVADLQQELQRLEAERARAETAYEESEMEFLVREEASQGGQPVAVGTVFEVSGFLLRTERNEARLEYGPHWDNASNSFVYLVLDPWAKSTAQVQPGRQVLVKVRAKSGAQLYLFRDWKRDSQGKKQMCTGYFVVAVISPKDYDSFIADTQSKLEAAQVQLQQLLAKRTAADRQKQSVQQPDARATVAEEPKVAYTFGDGDDESPIAAALRKALGE